MKIYRGRIGKVLLALRKKRIYVRAFSKEHQGVHHNRFSNLRYGTGKPLSPAEVRRYCAVLTYEAAKANVECPVLFHE
jgi:hypothetical protein